MEVTGAKAEVSGSAVCYGGVAIRGVVRAKGGVVWGVAWGLGLGQARHMALHTAVKGGVAALETAPEASQAL